MISLKKLFAVSLFSLFLASSAYAIESIVIRTGTTTGQSVIKFYDPIDASFIASLTVPRNLDGEGFITGNWLESEVSIATVTEQRNQFTAHILNSNGDTVNQIALGRRVLQIVADDFNNNGTTDLAIQYRGNLNVAIHFDPGTSFASVGSATLLRGTDFTPVYDGGSVLTGSVAFRRQIPRGLPRRVRRRRLRGSNTLRFTDTSGTEHRLRLAKRTREVLPLQLPATIGSFLGRNGNDLSVFSTAGQQARYNLETTAAVGTGFYTNNEETNIIVASGDGSIEISHPIDGVIRELELDLSASEPVEATARATFLPMVSDCEEYFRILDQISNLSDPNRILQILEQLNNLQIGPECFGDQNPGGNSGSGGSSGGDGPITVGAGALVAKRISYGTASAGSEGPCDRFANPRDGVNGFLARNADQGGIVYLTPSGGYSNGRILNTRNLRLVERTRFTGIANGGRGHFRTGGSFPKPSHIFAADFFDGNTVCWRIPGGSTRVD